MKQRFHALIADMDGVLVDSEPVHARAWDRVLGELGVTREPYWFLPWVGIPDDKLAEHLSVSGTVALSKTELLARKRVTYRTQAMDEVRAFPGVAEGLQRLNGTPCAVATSSGVDDARLALSAAGLLSFFPVLVCWDDVAYHKPAPDPYAQAAQRLGMPPDACIAIEDSPAGIASAKAAGCCVLAVATSHPEVRLLDADFTFATTAEALDWARARLIRE